MEPVKTIRCRLMILLWVLVAARLRAESTVDFGRVLPGTQWVHEFVFTNTWNHPLLVQSTDHSCSCVEMERTSTNIPPGKTGAVRVRFYTAGARGQVNEKLTLRFAGSDPSELSFGVTALVQSPVEATPDFVVLKPNPAAHTNVFTYVQITNHQVAEVLLTNVSSSTPRFVAQLETLLPGRSFRLRIEAIPPFNSGNTFGVLKINTGILAFPQLEVTAMVPAAK